MPIAIPVETLERWRDERWYRTSAKRVTTESDAIRFLSDVPCSLAFGGWKTGVPTLWIAACGAREPAFPKHSHHDPAVGLVWRAKESLVQTGAAYYGRLFLGKPSFVGRPWLATALAATPKGDLSPAARAVAAAVREAGPIPTKELGIRTGIRKRAPLVKALEEAQAAFAVVKVEERSEPFTFVWGTLDMLFELDVKEAAEIPAGTSRRKFVRLWLSELGIIPRRKLGSILGWPTATIDETLTELIDTGAILDGVRVHGWPGTNLADANVYSTLTSASPR